MHKELNNSKGASVATKYRIIRCTPEEVCEVLSNGWLYPTWVVGTSRMRKVDANWPEPGSRLHHSVGIWPITINDTTVSEEWDAPEKVVLTAKGWPIGVARVTIEIRPHTTGSLVRMVEEPVAGPGSWIPGWLSDPLLKLRNREVLRRLAYIAEGVHPTQGAA